MKKLAQVHMLPTEDNVHCGVWKDIHNKLYYHRGISKAQLPSIPQHLYFTTDEEIKGGEWGYNTVSNTIFQCREIDISTGEKYYINTGVLSPARNSRKIVATTNPELWLADRVVNGVAVSEYLNIAKIPLSFLKEYVDEKDSIKQVWLEYECTHADRAPNGLDCDLKLNPDGTVIISPEEEKMYTRNELKLAILHGWRDLEEINHLSGDELDRAFNNWFDKNYPFYE